MLMLSEIQRFRLVDDENRTSRIADLSVDLLADDYPPVKHIFFWNGERKFVALPFSEVRQIEPKQKVIHVSNLNRAAELNEETMAHEVSLVRDVLDALILDVQNRIRILFSHAPMLACGRFSGG
jgi:hypothetical protein